MPTSRFCHRKRCINELSGKCKNFSVIYFSFSPPPPHPLLFLTEVTLKLTLGNQKLFSTQRQNSMQATLAEIHTNHLHTRYHWNNTQDIIEITPNKIHLYKIFRGGQITSTWTTTELYKFTKQQVQTNNFMWHLLSVTHYTSWHCHTASNNTKKPLSKDGGTRSQAQEPQHYAFWSGNAFHNTVQ